MSHKILFIITSFHQGGIETYLLRFLTHTKGNITPIVLCNKNKFDTEFLDEFKIYNVKIVFLPINFSPTSIVRFYKLLKTEKIITVCDFRGDFSGLSLMISWAAKIKNRIVFYRESVHQFEPSFLKNTYVKLFNYLIIKFSTKILSNSSEAFKSFFNSSTLKGKYHRVLRNGVYNENEIIKKINIRSFYDIPANAFVVGHIGRYTPAKNHDLIVALAKKICLKDNNYYFLLCGADVKKNIYDDIIKYNLEKNIIVPGLCKDIYSHLEAMDVFLFPSYNEGQPNALIEAMISGVPVVASNIPSIKETVAKEMESSLLNPDAMGNFLKQIENIKNGDIIYDIEKVKIWAQDTYSQNKQFNEFYKELFNTNYS